MTQNMIVVAAVLATVLSGQAASASDCSVSVKGASWDLSLLEETLYTTDGDLECTKEVEQSYTYAFNVCGKAKKPSGCTGNGDVGVFQYDPKKPDNCYVAGKVTSMSMETLDPKDRAKGVKVTYKNGAVCHTSGNARTTEIEVLCDSAATTPQIDHAAEPLGPKTCLYSINIRSTAGCPLECARDSDGKVCGGHGLCMTDEATDSVHCYCDDGFGGEDCTSSGTKDENAAGPSVGIIVLAVFLFLLMVGLGVVLFMVVRQVHGYREDTNNYMNLRGGAE